LNKLDWFAVGLDMTAKEELKQKLSEITNMVRRRNRYTYMRTKHPLVTTKRQKQYNQTHNIKELPNPLTNWPKQVVKNSIFVLRFGPLLVNLCNEAR